MSYIVQALSTQDLGAKERSDWWRERVSEIHCPMSFALADDYSGRIEYQQSGRYRLVRWWGDAEALTRDSTQIRRSPHGSYELLIPVHGHLQLAQGDSDVVAVPHTLTLTSLDAAMDMRHGDNVSAVALVIPRDHLDSRLTRSTNDRPIALDARRGLGRIVVDQLRTIRGERDQLDGFQFDAVMDRIVDLIAIAYNDLSAPLDGVPTDALVDSIRRYVRSNAHDPALTGAGIAAGLGWSLRHIQNQLQRVGTTPSDLIREERLALARLRLQDPGWRAQSITQIAFSSGFGDLSTFSNAYHRSFGERPSDTRTAH
ncbi:AraC family transcriptional regulator [Mycolicibacterium llatzerense]|nr:AraC family transcriptional regulator [Mycolicibacterium llatzerense]